eukprot:c8256_g1_i1.p1 GENE.c8256_g1_i1~~c8256_g1_i1.p1  ORF type:complete len:285 (-),score=26.58 c8256_g1_i1:114-908(-)
MALATTWFSVVRAASLHVAKPTSWLTSRFHFNFEAYKSGPRKFGVLRVINDDEVAPNSGFETHPHEAMEIFTYVLRGTLNHRDSMGSDEALTRGAVQYMSAGTGLTHSEKNLTNLPSRILQLWVFPTGVGRRVAPRYGSRSYDLEERRNQLLPIVQDVTNPDADSRSCKIHQSVNVYASELAPSHGALCYTLPLGRQLYLVNAEGRTQVDLTGTVPGTEPVVLDEREGLKVKAEAAPVQVEFTALSPAEDSHFIFVEMPMSADT